MSFQIIRTIALVAALLITAVPITASADWLSDRQAERDARWAQIEAERAARWGALNPPSTAPSTDGIIITTDEGDDNALPPCQCTASVSLDRPSFQWRNGTLTFIPRVNVSVRSRGSHEQGWTLGIAHEGQMSYTSNDVATPAPHSFSGTRSVASGACGDRYSHQGLELSTVALDGIVPSLVKDKQKLIGTARLKLDLSGCQNVTKAAENSFTLTANGQIKTNMWRTLRTWPGI